MTSTLSSSKILSVTPVRIFGILIKLRVEVMLGRRAILLDDLIRIKQDIHQTPDETEQWWTLSPCLGENKHTQVHYCGDIPLQPHVWKRSFGWLDMRYESTLHWGCHKANVVWCCPGGNRASNCGSCEACCSSCEAHHTRSSVLSSWF